MIVYKKNHPIDLAKCLPDFLPVTSIVSCHPKQHIKRLTDSFGGNFVVLDDIGDEGRDSVFHEEIEVFLIVHVGCVDDWHAFVNKDNGDNDSTIQFFNGRGSLPGV
jgi:hypothetical protein